ncbi:hypothetical protein [Streptomyces canus]|uniref:hypothetical protein n=1 Tax=Streptomyces canus TaxID=58343 RepID=UPI00386CFAF8
MGSGIAEVAAVRGLDVNIHRRFDARAGRGGPRTCHGVPVPRSTARQVRRGRQRPGPGPAVVHP